MVVMFMMRNNDNNMTEGLMVFVCSSFASGLWAYGCKLYMLPIVYCRNIPLTIFFLLTLLSLFCVVLRTIKKSKVFDLIIESSCVAFICLSMILLLLIAMFHVIAVLAQ
jgi:hypothetical protein